MTEPHADVAEGEPVPDAAAGLVRMVGCSPDGRRITYYRRGTPPQGAEPAAPLDE